MEQEGKSAADLKETGNQCMRDGKFMEAVLHYSQAIKMEPINPLVHSNRSLAFLKIEQHYLALGDAEKCIQLNPRWPKGYFRKGEVLMLSQKYDDAVKAYQQGLDLQPDDPSLKEKLSKALLEAKNIKRADRNLPWFGIFTGLVIGILIIVGDDYIAQKPVVENSWVRAFIVVVVTLLGFACTRFYRYMRDVQKKSLLEPPIDLLKEMGGGIKRDEQGRPLVTPGKDNPPPWDPPSTPQNGSTKHNTKHRKKKR